MSKTLSFKALGISTSYLQALEELGFQQPTAIQEHTIPFLLKNQADFIAQAQTGTGKTAAFGLPLLSKINPQLPHIQAVVIAPTRELAKQIGKQLFKFTKYSTKIFTEVVAGGDKIDAQVAALQRPTQILVGTPGRIIDLIKRKALKLNEVKYVVLDEADEMLSMGFKKELEQIFAATSLKRQHTWLFSATIPDGIAKMITDYMTPDPHMVKIDAEHVVNRNIKHEFITCKNEEKLDALIEFLEEHEGAQGLIFCKMIAGAISLAQSLSDAGYATDALHGDLRQIERDKIIRSFRKQRKQLMVATDVAARGLDIKDLAFVVHYQLPEQIEYYTHRSGRTGRAGKKGLSISFIHPREKQALQNISKVLGIEFKAH